ncbi:MAG: MMPL family transporter, partial [Candidatus Thermoplasmatota archaeon]|nr:MMPL family transporter [Candidatus Thermoplasmatota archaeon]
MTKGKRALGRGLAKVSLTATRWPKRTMAVLLLITMVLGYGVTQVQFSSDLIDVLPRGNPNTEAARNVSENFPGHHSYVTFLFAADPDKWQEANQRLQFRIPPEYQAPPNGTTGPQYQPGHPHYEDTREHAGEPGWNVSDEVYIRGMEEFFQYLRDRAAEEELDANIYATAWNSHVKLVNWTNEIARNCAPEPFVPNVPGVPSTPDAPETPCNPNQYAHAFTVPGITPQQESMYATDWGTVWTSAPKEVQTQASPDWLVTRPVYIFEPQGDRHATQEDYYAWGSFFLKVADEYRTKCEAGTLTWDVFDCELLAINDAKIVTDAHQADLTKEDLSVLGPAALLFILVALYFAFRGFKPVGVGFGALTTVAIWSYGLLGWLGIPLNELNLAVVPLILGNGIDFSIHYIVEYLEHAAEGKSDEEAWEVAGQRAGSAIFIATATTVAGLLIMGLSPSPLIAELGLLAAFAMASMLFIVLTFIPAGLKLLGRGPDEIEFTPSRFMPKLAGTVSKHRGKAIALVLVATIGLGIASQGLTYETFGDPSKNFPEDNPIRMQEDAANKAFFGRDVADFESNWLILEGDLTDPAAHAYMRDLQRDLAQHREIRTDSVTGITNLVTQWVSIKDGTPGAVPKVAFEQAEEGSTYPDSREEITANLDQMYNSP